MQQTGWCIEEGVWPENEPRFVASKEGMRAMRDGSISSIKLIFDSFDPITQRVTLKPVGRAVRTPSYASADRCSLRPL